MPTVPKTDKTTILREARAIIERDGLAALTMESLAKACGVRAASLYGHFTNRAAIVTALATEAMRELEAAGHEALADAAKRKAGFAGAKSAIEDEPLVALALGQRRFAQQHPSLYALVFSTPLQTSPELDAASRSAVHVVCQHVAAARRSSDSSAPEVLEGARLIVAFTNGFVSMELVGAFRMGGDIERAFVRGVEAIISTFKAT